MNCVERSISLFAAQTVKSELIVFNTDVDNPVELDGQFDGVRVFNNNTDYQTGEPYRDIGAIRRDALTHALGEYYICWDDDDIFLPWNNRQCLDGIASSDAWAWKPFSSMWSWGNHGIEIAQNAMEASIIARTEKVREHGYAPHAGGGEHLKWTKAFDSNMVVSKDSIPAYSFNWSDPPAIAGHKQSGTIDRADNFELHKAGCTDTHTRPLRRIDVQSVIQEYARFLSTCVCQTFHGHTIEPKLFEKYAGPYL